VNDHSRTVAFNHFALSKKKLLFIFPQGPFIKTKYCGGGHLGLLIHKKKCQLNKAPLNDHSCTVWVQ
jgi:hypothetical protein